MISSKEDAIQFFRGANEKNEFNKDELQPSIEMLQKTALEDGLSESEIDDIVKFISTNKITSQIGISLFNILIPVTTISKRSLEEIILWLFIQIGNENISNALGKKCIQWLTGITFYELADTSVIESYYYSFIFLLHKPYLESSICRLLCLISKPEDAKRWVVQQILSITYGNPKPHANALLGLLKSYRPNVVPERISATNFHYKTTPFDETLKKAHERKSKTVGRTSDVTFSESNIRWNTFHVTDKRSRKLNRLIPSPDCINMEGKIVGKKLQSIYEFKTMTSLGVSPRFIECPAETLSLLANTAGHHVLAFSDFSIKTRFFHKLYHTLCRVFLLELEPYTEREKLFFLNAIKELQEYTQQSIPVVTTFLYYYIPIWDGEQYREQILSLLEWLDVCDDDLERFIFPSLRQIFISSGTHCKCLIIKTMGKLMRNLLIMDKKEQNCFRTELQNSNVFKSIEAISDFVHELVSNGLIWNNEKTTRSILNSALDFYEMTQAVEQAGDLPMIMIMPPALVYKCLFSGSRVCIARLCSLLVGLQTVSVERLYLLGVFEDFADEVQKLNIYILDFYRCFWSKINFREEEDSFIFQHEIFNDKFWKLTEIYGNVMNKIFSIEYNSSFWDPKTKGLHQVILCQLAEDYPAIVRLKQMTEERLLQVY